MMTANLKAKDEFDAEKFMDELQDTIDWLDE